MKSQKDRDGRVPLHYAALENDVAAAKARLAAGDEPDASDREGFTPLHFAAQQGSVEVLQLLLDRGAKVDSVNRFGNTPLWVAVANSRGRGDLIALLRQHGADPLKTNNYRQTPVGLARLIGNYDVARWFSDLAVQK
jgi:ankyrin repeat protein